MVNVVKVTDKPETLIAKSPWICADLLGCPVFACAIKTGDEMVLTDEGKRYHPACYHNVTSGENRVTRFAGIRAALAIIAEVSNA